MLLGQSSISCPWDTLGLAIGCMLELEFRTSRLGHLKPGVELTWS